MRISARCDYACRALLELSLHWPQDEPLTIHAIAQKQGIPIRYLVQILIALKNHGFVASSRGKMGGYNLACDPEEITLGDVMRKLGGALLPVAGTAKKNGSVFADVWKEAELAMSKVLDKVTFEDICKKMKEEGKVLFYQI
ncbi:MAG: Rrf2 family transcriptional regulator [Candidatus Omnitrophica bacterium]|nr:Rrf2 family transcriptional regulator [Candidatus Omnitrophota bacterium]